MLVREHEPAQTPPTKVAGSLSRPSLMEEPRLELRRHPPRDCHHSVGGEGGREGGGGGGEGGAEERGGGERES